MRNDDDTSVLERLRVLIVDDDPSIRKVVRLTLEGTETEVEEAGDGQEGLRLLRENHFDVVILDWMMPKMTGLELAQRLREQGEPPWPRVLMLTSRSQTEDRRAASEAGLKEFLVKPFSPLDLLQTVRGGKALPAEACTPDSAADAATSDDANLRQLERFAKDLSLSYEAERRRAEDVDRAHHDTVLRLLHVTKLKDQETGAHLVRISRYVGVLGHELGFRRPVIASLQRASMLHDVGKIGVPDSVLRKPGPLDSAEWELMKQHTLIGASILDGSTSPLLDLGRQIALSHHENWDGSGYPHGLRGADIPVAGHLVKIADNYDALRSERPYKRAFDHRSACRIILEGDERTKPSHFDPHLLGVFRIVEEEFSRIAEEYVEETPELEVHDVSSPEP